MTHRKKIGHVFISIYYIEAENFILKEKMAGSIWVCVRDKGPWLSNTWDRRSNF